MKHMPFIFVFALMLLLAGCQEKTTRKNTNNSNSPLCVQYPTSWGCPGYNGGGSTVGGTSGGTTSCTNPTINDRSCTNYCSVYPYPRGTGCLANGTNCNTSPTASGCSNTNIYPNYPSYYVDKNWMVKYPYIPAVSCSEPYAPSGISYTPYETRKGTITIAGTLNYDPASGQAFTTTTSELLRTVDGAQDFFWGDSKLKVRFKANLQPESRNTTDVCAGRVPNKSWMHGYSRIKFNLALVGRKYASNGTTVIQQEVSLGEKTIDINNCTPALDLSNYARTYPLGIYFKVTNVKGNQNWSPSAYPWYEQMDYDTWGFYPNRSYNGNSYMSSIRSVDCWSLDIEVAADGTKTFN